MPVALVTGGSAGLGRALAHALADDGWTVVVDGRDADRLAAAADRPGIHPVPGDVTDTEHRAALVAAVRAHGGLDLLVHNASTLGPLGLSTWLPALADVTVDDLQHVWRTNLGAPLVLTTQLLDELIASRGILVGISSDAAVEHYPGWGLYGASKAGLDHLVLTFAAENDAITAYAVDPGDMRTQMHADAFPGEDISDRPLPGTVVPHLLALIEQRPASGRYRAADVPVPAGAGGLMRLLTEQPSTHFPAPAQTTAPAPPEARGLERDAVRLLVVTPDGVTHTEFRELAAHLRAGDLVVVNDSATVAAELDATGPAGPVVVHLATPLEDGSRVMEVRTAPDAARAVLDLDPGSRFRAGAVEITLRTPYPHPGSSPTGNGNRLWCARVDGPLAERLATHGRPIAYGYLAQRYPLDAYQTVFGTRPGSAEMPSAARPFTPRVVTDLVARGVTIAPVTLHTGVSSQEAGEAPQPERYAVPGTTARLVNAVRAGGGRVVAVGTTVTRALESAVADDGRVVARSGWTERVVTPEDPPRVVDGLVTGWHDPQASHLLLVEAVAGRALSQTAYDAAVAGGYLWHEFGDSALLLP